MKVLILCKPSWVLPHISESPPLPLLYGGFLLFTMNSGNRCKLNCEDISKVSWYIPQGSHHNGFKPWELFLNSLGVVTGLDNFNEDLDKLRYPTPEGYK